MNHTKIKLALFALIISLFLISNVSAIQTDIIGPAGSGSFGLHVAALPNGNIVVTDPYYDAPGPIVNVGAVYLYNGATGTLISTLTGETANSYVGEYGFTSLSNGNYVVNSPSWDSPTLATNNNAGAATWCSGTNGCNGTVSASNSIVGGTTGDRIGRNGVKALTNGNYVVSSQFWNNPSLRAYNSVGAITWGNGASGTIGVVSASNSLIGSTEGDIVGSFGVVALPNGNYVARNGFWDNPAPLITDVGAVTWCNGAGGTVGELSASNSLIGSSDGDGLGNQGIFLLSNGNYVVNSQSWSNPLTSTKNVGAVTWGNGESGITGVVSAGNSLIGSSANDQNGGGAVLTTLTNGNYVVISVYWDNPSPLITDAGAVTWGNGAVGTVGIVSASNSLVGGSNFNNVGIGGVTPLSNGNYVVKSPYWDNPSPTIEDVGAVTWGNGVGGSVGVVSANNSLIGSSANDIIGGEYGVIPLKNGNYVVGSPDWDNPIPMITNVGAVTWGNGEGGTTGLISSSNSLIGQTAFDNVGSIITALSNGNYVVNSFDWDNPSLAANNKVGAVTWGNGTSGITGFVSSSNSLIGSSKNDHVGDYPVTALTNGNYVVSSPYWDNPSLGANNDAGAATLCNGASGTIGIVSSGNSLIGGSVGDNVGTFIRALPNGNYVVSSQNWDNPSPVIANVGAVTWGNGANGTVGLVSASNSLVGGSTGDNIGNGTISVLSNGNYVVRNQNWDNPIGPMTNAGAVSYGLGGGGTVGLLNVNNSVRGTRSGNFMYIAFDAVNNQLVVGREVDNIVTLFKPTATPKSNKRIRIFL